MKDKICVVAGVGPGNGAAFARRFASVGYTVALLARRKDFIEPLAKELPDARAYTCDLTSKEDVRTTFAKIQSELGPAQVLLHNGAGFARGAFLDTTPEDFESAWRGGPWSLLLAGKEAAAQMVERGGGAIVVVGATASVRGSEGFAAFASAKAGHRSLAQSMARNLGPKGVHVAYIVVDGVIDTPTGRRMMADKPDDFFLKPSAIAETAFHLAHQDRSAWTFELDLRPASERW